MKINGKTILSTSSTTTNYVLKQSSTVGTLINSQIFDNGTNVGIGTTSPSAKTAIHKSESGSNPSAVLRLENTGANYTSKLILTDGTTNDANISYIGATQSLSFGIGASLNQMILNPSGNVGIGTIAPDAKLSIYSGASVTDYIAFNVGDGSNKISFVPYVATGDYNSLSYGGGSLLFNTVGSRLTIGTQNGTGIQFGPTNTLISGNVGIGTTSPEPSSLLDLSSITQGFLAPRMRTSERDSIGSPANGLIIFNTDSETIDVFTNGGGWKSVLFL